MTRINLVPVEELTDKHLGGEFHEISRVYSLVLKRVKSDKPVVIPKQYQMGKGHVQFFYDKLIFITDRYLALANEIKRRNRNSTLSYRKVIDIIIDYRREIPNSWWNSWYPEESDLKVSRQRILEKL